MFVLYSCSEFVDLRFLLLSETYQMLGNVAVEMGINKGGF